MHELVSEMYGLRASGGIEIGGKQVSASEETFWTKVNAVDSGGEKGEVGGGKQEEEKWRIDCWEYGR